MTRPTAAEAAFASPAERERDATVSVLLVQLGTPDEPEPAAVRRYLKQFLSDPRVVEIPRWIWLPILHTFVLTRRPKQSAEKYRAIWTKDGSPLLVNTRRQASLLRGFIGQPDQNGQKFKIEVAYAMRYGNPSIESVLRNLRDRGMQRLLVLPMYPQYSAATAASVFDAVWAELGRWRVIPDVRMISQFHDRPDLIAAQAARIQKVWDQQGRPDKLVFSFHGLPQRSVDLGDPYQQQCLNSARLLAQALRLKDDDYVTTFQSRFGKAKWLTPYTDVTLAQLGAAKLGRVDVVCPGFIADCLETLEEIAIEGRETFIAAGGGEFRYIECLNDSPGLILSLRALVSEQLAGWPVPKVLGTPADSADPAAPGSSGSGAPLTLKA